MPDTTIGGDLLRLPTYKEPPADLRATAQPGSKAADVDRRASALPLARIHHMPATLTGAGLQPSQPQTPRRRSGLDRQASWGAGSEGGGRCATHHQQDRARASAVRARL